MRRSIAKVAKMFRAFGKLDAVHCPLSRRSSYEAVAEQKTRRVPGLSSRCDVALCSVTFLLAVVVAVVVALQWGLSWALLPS